MIHLDFFIKIIAKLYFRLAKHKSIIRQHRQQKVQTKRVTSYQKNNINLNKTRFRELMDVKNPFITYE